MSIFMEPLGMSKINSPAANGFRRLQDSEPATQASQKVASTFFKDPWGQRTTLIG